MDDTFYSAISEENSQAAARKLTLFGKAPIDIIPPLGVKGILDKRLTQDAVDLGASLPLLDPVNLVSG